jgi:hypothetical protein
MWVCFAYLMEKRWFATSLIGGISCGDTLSRCIIKQMTKPIPTVWAVCVSVLSMFQFDLSSNFILTLWCDLQPWRMHHSLGHASIYKRKIILLCTLMVILIIQHNSLSVGVCFFFCRKFSSIWEAHIFCAWSSLPTRKFTIYFPSISLSKLNSSFFTSYYSEKLSSSDVGVYFFKFVL